MSGNKNVKNTGAKRASTNGKRRPTKKQQREKIIFWAVIAVILVAAIVFLGVNGYLTDAYEILLGADGGANGTATETTGGTQNGSSVTHGASYGTIDGAANVKIHFVSIGQGDAIIVELPDKEYMLIDAGSTTSGLDAIRTYYNGYLADIVGDDEIDYMVVTHPDLDHINMLSGVLASYKVDNIYYNYYSAASATYKTFMSDAENEGAALTKIDTADDARFDFAVGGCSVTLYSCRNAGTSRNNPTIPNS